MLHVSHGDALTVMTTGSSTENLVTSYFFLTVLLANALLSCQLSAYIRIQRKPTTCIRVLHYTLTARCSIDDNLRRQRNSNTPKVSSSYWLSSGSWSMVIVRLWSAVT